jgi:hypothetical protein
MSDIQGSTPYLQKSVEKCPVCKNRNMVFYPATNDGD